jgi:hypothetical protein
VLYTTWFVCAKELLAESERAVSKPQCHMGADSDKTSIRDNYLNGGTGVGMCV